MNTYRIEIGFTTSETFRKMTGFGAKHSCELVIKAKTESEAIRAARKQVEPFASKIDWLEPR